MSPLSPAGVNVIAARLSVRVHQAICGAVT